MQTHEIRKRFLDHFVKAGHTEVPSASVILDDPNLLFVNAGMVQFVPYFLGQRTPPWNRAVSVQKCIRTPDIDEVGITTRHNTFFQMAGNFSFGDYFKKGAIEFAWTLLTNPVDQGGYGLDPERLWATVYLDDDEAIGLWQEVAGLPPERIQRRGMADNYWSMGIPGPCGPSSEIYYDRGPEYGIEGGPEANEDRYIEIWNLVFMQNERGEGTSKENFEILGPAAAQEHRHRHGYRAGGLPAAGRRQRLRDRPAASGDRRDRRGRPAWVRSGQPRRRRPVSDHRRSQPYRRDHHRRRHQPGKRRSRLRPAPPAAKDHPGRQAARRRATDHGGTDDDGARHDGTVVPGTGRRLRSDPAHRGRGRDGIQSDARVGVAAVRRGGGRDEGVGHVGVVRNRRVHPARHLWVPARADPRDGGRGRPVGRRRGLPRLDGRAAPARQGRRGRPQAGALRSVGLPRTRRHRARPSSRDSTNCPPRQGFSGSLSTESGCR